MAVDGTLRFNTKIDADGFIKGTDKLSSKAVELKYKISAAEREVKNLTEEIKKMADTPIKSDAVASLEKQVEKAKSKFNELTGKADEMFNKIRSEQVSMGFGDSHLDDILSRNSEWQKLQNQISEADTALLKYERELESAKATESQATGKDTAEYAQKKQKIEDLNAQIDVYKAKLRETTAQEKKTASSEKNVTKIFQRLSKALKEVTSRMKNAFKNTVINSLKRLTSNAKKTNSQMGILAKSLNRIKQALAGMLLYKVLSGGLNSLTEGFNNLAKESPKVNESLSALMTSLKYMKNSLASAFAPILNVVTPILTKFMDTISQVTNKVGQFIATLTGQTTYTKAIKVQKDYAESLDDTAKATENLEKETGNLASFDELNVMQQQDTAQSSDTDTNAGTLFETIPTVFSDFANKLKEAFTKGNFKEMGQLVADKLNQAMKSIKWSKIRSTAKNWASNIAEFLNGAVEKYNWKLLGKTIADGINTAAFFADKLFGKKGINFKKIGESIANGLNSLIKSLDTKKIGEVLADVVNIVINFAEGFSYNFDWKELGKSIRSTLESFFSNLNVQGAIKAFTSTVNGLVTSSIALIGTPDFRQWGINVVNGIRDTLQQINWENISTLFSNLVIGALDFIDGMVISINWEELGNNIAESFNNFFGEEGDGYKIIKSMITTFSNLLWGLFVSLDTIIDSVDWKSLGENLVTALTDFIKPKEDKSWIDLLTKTANDIVTSLLDFINGVFAKQESADMFADGFSQMLNNIDYEEIFIGALSAILNIGSWLLQLAIDLIDNFCEGLAKGFSDAEDNEVLNKAISGLGKAIGNLLITAFEGLLRILVNAIPNFFIGLFKTILNALAGIVGLFLGDEWYQSATNGLWGENSLKVDIPINIPRLATGAYVPANYGEFLAILGDNKREPEFVTPESKLEQTIERVMEKYNFNGRNGDIHVTVVLPDGTLLNAVGMEDDQYKKRHGRSRFAY